MASENRKQGDEPQLSISSPRSDEELASFHLQDGTDNLLGISNREAGSVHCGQGMPFSDGGSLFRKQDYLNNPVSDYSVSIRNLKEADLGPAFGDSGASASIHASDSDNSLTERNIAVSGVEVVKGLQTCRPGREFNGGVPLSVHYPTSGELGPNISWMDTVVRETNVTDIPGPWHTGNQFIQAGCASVSGHDPTIGELVMSNFVMTGAAQSDHPGVIDGDFLSRGCRTSEETDPKCDIRCPGSEQLTGRVLLPLFSTSPDQINSGSSLNYSSNMANGTSIFPNRSGIHRRVTNEAPYRARSLGQNASRFPRQAWRANQIPNPLPIQNVEGSFNPVLNRFSHQAPATNIGVPNAARFRVTRTPSSSSMVGFTQPSSERLQNPPIAAVRNFLPGPAMAPPFIEVPGWMARHGQSGHVTVPCSGEPRSMLLHGQLGPVVVPSLGPLRSMPWQGQSGQPVQANAVAAAKATEGNSFSNNIRFQQASKGVLDQSQASTPVKPLKSMHARAHSSDQEIHDVPQSSDIHSGPSRKRGASKLLPIAPAAQRRKTRSRPSMPALRQVAPHVSPSSVNSLARSFQNPAPLFESLLGTLSTDYIKWKEEDTGCPSGFQCPICKRDLSYAPEGPMYQKDTLEATSVLPCGHYFHSSCLLRITPADQSENPPCIPCALGG